MGGPWQPIIYDLNKGLDESTSALEGENSALVLANNVDTSERGVIKGRPSFSQHDGFGSRTLQNVTGATGQAISASDAGSATTWATLLSKYPFATMHRYRDSLGERPLITSLGRSWTYEGDRWTDRLYGGCAKVERVADLATQYDTAGAPLTDPATSADPTTAWACASTFGPSRVTSKEFVILGQGNTEEARVSVGQAISAVGNSAFARTPGFEALVTVTGANNLVVSIRQAGHFSGFATAVLFSDAQLPTGIGDAPCISADYDTGVFYIAYATTTAHTVKIVRVDTGANVLTSTTFTYGTGTVKGVWIANSNVATDRLVVAVTDSISGGCFTTVRHMTTLATYTIDVNTGLDTPLGPVVIGGLDGNANWWLAYKVTTGIDVFTRSSTAATVTFVTSWLSANYGITGNGVAGQGRELYLVHQPVNVAGRIVLGLGSISAFPTTGGRVESYYAIDLTDTWVVGTSTGTLNNPIIAAQGPRDGYVPHWGPAAATVNANTNANVSSFRFPSLSYRTFGADQAGVAAIAGVNAAAGINEVTFYAPASDHAREGTIVAGSVPHALARGYSHEVGFPVGRPTIKVVSQNNAGGFLGLSAVGTSYTMFAVWRWTDEAGQVHRSEPSVSTFVNFTSAVTTGQVVVQVEAPFTEREFGVVYVDVYMTDANPVATAPHWLQVSRFASVRGGGALTNITLVGNGSAGSGLVSHTGDQMYTDGGVMPNFPPNAQGGIATVGNRTWVSDGINLYASKLTNAGEAPSWCNLGPLTQVIPATAGRVQALQAMDDKLLIFCQRGVYYLVGQGPDNTGQGGGFSVPARLSDLGVFGPRLSGKMTEGVAFMANNAFVENNDLGAYAGLWVVDRGLSIKRASWPAQTELIQASMVDLVSSPERESVWLNSSLPDLVVWDARAGLWHTWDTPGGESAQGTAVVAGVLWTLTNQGNVGSYDNLITGIDALRGGQSNVAMSVTTQFLFANGKDGLGWSSIRSVRVLGEITDGTLQYQALQDQQFSSASPTFTMSSVGVSTWPTSRYAPQWFLPRKKCSSIQVTMTAIPATATWSALELQVIPANRAPAFQRG